MRKSIIFPLFCIQLFADGGTGAGEAGQATGAEAAIAQPQTGVKGNPLANVQYGKQEVTAPDAGEARVATDERQARFDAMIKGEFKDLYDARVQDTIRRRLKGNEEIVSKFNKISGTFDLLGSKYGLDPNADDFVDKLSEEIEKDETYFEDEALEKGLSVEQIKEARKMKRENARLRAELDARDNQKQAETTLAAWKQAEQQIKGVYPSFDLATELQNEQFRQLLYSNVPMQTAFEVIHKDEIIPAAMQYTAQQVEQKVANSVRAGQRRPAEAAMRGNGGVVHKSDVSKLTKADIEEINRRVARGERITF